jgi:PAS domain S-box-containing protein
MGYIKRKWKAGLNIGRHENLHYLEVQRNALMNALIIMISIISALYVFANMTFNTNNSYISLIAFPFCFLVLWLNSKHKYKLARNIAFFSFLFMITFWSFYTRRCGAQFLLIPLACCGASLYREKRNVLLTMIACSVSFMIYTIVDIQTPFVPYPGINYFTINMVMSYVAAGIVFFQIMLYVDITSHFSRSLDRKLKELNFARDNQKIIEKKLQFSNEELLGFNKKLDTLARQSNEELHSYQNAINDNLYSLVTDLDGIILKINQPYVTATKYSKEELIGVPIRVLNADSHPENFYETIRTEISKNNIWRGEVKNKAKDGTYFWMVSSILPLHNNDGAIAKFFIISSDITAKKLAENKEETTLKELTENEKRLRLLLENQIDLVVISEKGGKRKFVNESFCTFFGKEKEFFIGTNYRTQDPENVTQSYLNIFDSLTYENPKIITLDILENAEGEKRWVQWDEVALFDESKKITEILSIGHDITELKEIEFQSANYIAQFEEMAFKNSYKFREPLDNLIQAINVYDLQKSTKEDIIQMNGLIKKILGDLDIATRELSDFINAYHAENKPLQENITLNADFENAKSKHLNWKYKIKNFFEGSSSLTYNQAVSEQVSDLGKWFYNEGKEKYGHLPPMQVFEIEHKKLHEITATIIALKNNGDNDNAEIKFKELQQISDKIILLLDEASRIVT